MGVRGFLWAIYHSDDGNPYALQVDRDYAADTTRGWAWPPAPGTPVYPRGWVARRVGGIDDSGRQRFAVVASTSADLWTGVATQFTIDGTDEASHACTVNKRVPERFSARPH